ncbi:hypothetical protein chiPu_0022769, partial [Chiloscyllium punctatum]|nr:hypothetical protein [Chiloscyllium punctatum]
WAEGGRAGSPSPTPPARPRRRPRRAAPPAGARKSYICGECGRAFAKRPSLQAKGEPWCLLSGGKITPRSPGES